MTGLVSALLLASGMSCVLGPEARVEGERAVERARYTFVLGATRPFDEAYPRPVFEKRVAGELRQERALAKSFGFEVTPELLAREFERVERDTKAPDQWQAVKTALGDDRRFIEEVVCRPLIVDRTLRWRFAFDAATHAAPHAKARAARARWQAGEAVEGARLLTLSRRSAPESTDRLLEKARSSASGPRVLSAEPPAEEDHPLPLHPDALRVLEEQLGKRGDVSPILSERDRFAVYRLLEVSGETWRVEAVFFPKVDFEAWLAAFER
jgi:hypothetical protein